MNKTRTTVARRKTRAANPLNVSAVYARRRVEALAARVKAEGQVLTITCPECKATWEVEVSDMLTEKTCPACGHVWTPEAADYLATQPAEAKLVRASSMASIVSNYYGGAR